MKNSITRWQNVFKKKTSDCVPQPHATRSKNGISDNVNLKIITINFNALSMCNSSSLRFHSVLAVIENARAEEQIGNVEGKQREPLRRTHFRSSGKFRYHKSFISEFSLLFLHKNLRKPKSSLLRSCRRLQSIVRLQ